MDYKKLLEEREKEIAIGYKREAQRTAEEARSKAAIEKVAILYNCI